MSTVRWLVTGALLLTGVAGAAVFEPRDFPSTEVESRYKTLIYELRCLVCQNQNLADSNADLASDLRREVYRMLVAGRSDDEIIDFMTARYGDFVLYRPPLKAKTVLLWSGPFVLAAGGLTLLLLQLRRRRAMQSSSGPLSEEERDRLKSLLDRK